MMADKTVSKNSGVAGWRLEQTGILYTDPELYNKQQMASKLGSFMEGFNVQHLYEVPFCHYTNLLLLKQSHR